ncbi:MAG: Ribosomal RNA small subunit methyltransferase I [Rhodospirillaceae bacterium]|nr:MAG: Ribosomal RNA small subunit methyltransferase I [Rhodospirillaceae bacterium]
MLNIVSTPIGNLGDFSPRAMAALQEADIIACEDTRTTRKLLALCSLEVRAKLMAYHDHNGQEMRPKLLALLEAGRTIALVSDAGTPLISDPGYKLVAACHSRGVRVTATPGPAAPLMALTISGLPTDRFTFQGFVPQKQTAARAQITESANLPMTQIWFETPRRLAKTLALMAEIYGERNAAITRELTKLHETVEQQTLGVLAQKFADIDPPKGELVLLVSGADKSAKNYDEEAMISLLEDILSRASVKDAAKEAEALTGWPRRTLYQMALKIARRD